MLFFFKLNGSIVPTELTAHHIELIEITWFHEVNKYGFVELLAFTPVYKLHETNVKCTKHTVII